MKILLAGAAGQLGHTLRRQLPSAGSRRQLSIHKKGRKGDSDEPDAPLLLERELTVGELGPSDCVGGAGSNGTTRERTNKQMVEAICSDRGGHDRHYAIDPTGDQHRAGLAASANYFDLEDPISLARPAPAAWARSQTAP